MIILALTHNRLPHNTFIYKSKPFLRKMGQKNFFLFLPSFIMLVYELKIKRKSKRKENNQKQNYVTQILSNQNFRRFSYLGAKNKGLFQSQFLTLKNFFCIINIHFMF